MIVSYLPDPERHPLWEGIKGLLEPAVENAPVLERNELVWVAFEDGVLFAAGTTVLNKDGTAEILACGGHKHRKWVKQAEGVVSAWARDCGATKLIMTGRMGWARYLRAFGWVSAPSGTYEKDLG